MWKKCLFYQEDANRGKPNWEHLSDELHVLITVEDTENRAHLKLERAVEEVKKLLVPVSTFRNARIAVFPTLLFLQLSPSQFVGVMYTIFYLLLLFSFDFIIVIKLHFGSKLKTRKITKYFYTYNKKKFLTYLAIF